MQQSKVTPYSILPRDLSTFELSIGQPTQSCQYLYFLFWHKSTIYFKFTSNLNQIVCSLFYFFHHFSGMTLFFPKWVIILVISLKVCKGLILWL